jgi:hypothetical protein
MHLWLAIIIGVMIYRWAGHTALSRLKIGEITPALLTYGAIALGFSIAGLTLALTLPDREFAKRLADSVLPKLPPKQNAYSDLLFVFSWTAVLHWMVIIIALCSSVLVGQDQEILPQQAGVGHRLIVSFLVSAVVYSVCQFLVTVITLSEVGQTYIGDLRKRENNGPSEH